MKESVKSKSISKTDGKPYSFKDVCLKFSPGSHYLLSSSEKSELNRFGVGISLALYPCFDFLHKSIPPIFGKCWWYGIFGFLDLYKSWIPRIRLVYSKTLFTKYKFKDHRGVDFRFFQHLQVLLKKSRLTFTVSMVW